MSAYAAGVNAYQLRAVTQRRVPLEYRLIGAAPEPWTPLDSLLIGGYMAWSQSFNVRHELAFLRLAARLGPERARELFPTDVGISAPPLPRELSELLGAEARTHFGPASGLHLDAVVALIGRLGLPQPSVASNAWAVTGARTADGAALLANDPHLAASMPGIWYELELITPELAVVGASLPGIPLVMIGHNRDLAWGMTSTVADTQDLFIERLTPDQLQVERPNGELEPILTRFEHIRVKGGDTHELPVQSTRHGVILNPVLGPMTRTPMDLPQPDTAYRLALRQSKDQPDLSFAGLRRLNQARTLEEASAAILDFRHVVLNLMMADRDGRIGFQTSGVLPQRGAGLGAFPALGWVADQAWQGSVPQALNPRLLQPPGAALINANHRIIPVAYPVNVSQTWMAPFRAERIAARIAQVEPVTAQEMARIQLDTISIQARLTQQAVRSLEMALRAVDAEAWDIAVAELLEWDGDMSAHSRAAAFYALLEPSLYRALYGDELGDDLETLTNLAAFSYSPLQETLRTGRSSFWDDVTTDWIEEPAEIWARALTAAKGELVARLGSAGDPGLAALRTLTFPHAFGTLPLIGSLFNVGPIGVGGHLDTVALMKPLPLAPESVLFVPSMRVVFTPDDWSRTQGIQPLGQSGHRFSPYRTDQLAHWRAGRLRAWPWQGPSADETLGVLTLLPSR